MDVMKPSIGYRLTAITANYYGVRTTYALHTGHTNGQRKRGEI
jgi:hypothetical protein